jgi:cbb3-type cytochrome oxidase maturation protein
MNIIYFLIPLGLVLLVAAVAAFFWAVRSGQFDDLETPAWRILMDDDKQPPHDRLTSMAAPGLPAHGTRIPRFVIPCCGAGTIPPSFGAETITMTRNAAGLVLLVWWHCRWASCSPPGQWRVPMMA